MTSCLERTFERLSIDKHMTPDSPETDKQPVHLTDKAKAARDARAEREAKALRANLLRRKQQQRLRPEMPPTPSES